MHLIIAIRTRADGDWHDSEHESRLEIRGSEHSSAITSVTKDNLVLQICTK